MVFRGNHTAIPLITGHHGQIFIEINSLGGDGNIGKKFTDGKYSRVLNKWLLESQIYYFMFVPDEALLQSTITSFIDAFEKMSSEDFQFRSSLEYSQKDLAQYRVRFQSIRQLVNKLFKLNISHFPLSEKH